MKKYKLGIYGGTFAPIHNGHVNAARCFYDSMGLDRLLIIPTFIPPHKDAEPDDIPEARLEMARLAFEDERRNIDVSDYEISKGETSYTYLTLRHFSSPDTDITFLCGTDMFLSFNEWKRPDEIFALAGIALIRREKNDDITDRLIAEAKTGYMRDYSADIKEINTEPVDISSTRIREMIASGKDISGLVPERVYGYIKEKGLYGFVPGEITYDKR